MFDRNVEDSANCLLDVWRNRVGNRNGICEELNLDWSVGFVGLDSLGVVSRTTYGCEDLSFDDKYRRLARRCAAHNIRAGRWGDPRDSNKRVPGVGARNSQKSLERRRCMRQIDGVSGLKRRSSGHADRSSDSTSQTSKAETMGVDSYSRTRFIACDTYSSEVTSIHGNSLLLPTPVTLILTAPHIHHRSLRWTPAPTSRSSSPLLAPGADDVVFGVVSTSASGTAYARLGNPQRIPPLSLLAPLSDPYSSASLPLIPTLASPPLLSPLASRYRRVPVDIRVTLDVVVISYTLSLRLRGAAVVENGSRFFESGGRWILREGREVDQGERKGSRGQRTDTKRILPKLLR
ncbi:hypothetical protein R3P38DRAFT_3445032 [Favolaschia claudopus]|uniref:Uncharacterized protein n=1 Tax=Favolaschia claudopus TaxID=2862362 RepID=A0AAV9ZP27_9AGAR